MCGVCVWCAVCVRVVCARVVCVRVVVCVYVVCVCGVRARLKWLQLLLTVQLEASGGVWITLMVLISTLISSVFLKVPMRVIS